MECDPRIACSVGSFDSKVDVNLEFVYSLCDEEHGTQLRTRTQGRKGDWRRSKEGVGRSLVSPPNSPHPDLDAVTYPPRISASCTTGCRDKVTSCHFTVSIWRTLLLFLFCCHPFLWLRSCRVGRAEGDVPAAKVELGRPQRSSRPSPHPLVMAVQNPHTVAPGVTSIPGLGGGVDQVMSDTIYSYYVR